MSNDNKKKRMFKDELKDDDKKEQKRAEAIATMEAALDKLTSNPNSWNNAELDNVKSMICKIGSDKNACPPPPGETDVAHAPKQTETQLITKNLNQQSRQNPKHDECNI